MGGHRGVLVVLAGLVAIVGLTAAVQAAHQDDAGTGNDAPDRRGADAPRLESYEVYTGQLGYVEADAGDWYTLSADAGEDVWLAIQATSACANLHAPGGGERIDRACSNHGDRTDPTITEVPDDGVYHVQVRSNVIQDGPRGEGGLPQDYRLGVGVGEPAPPVHEDALPPAFPGEADGCPQAPKGEDKANRGAGDPYLDDLRWAATKTGYRAGIAFDAPDAEQATTRYHVDGGPERSQTVPTPGENQLIVLDRLPTGHALCFQVTTSSPAGETTSEWHGLRLANGPTAYDAGADAYNVNLLVGADSAVVARALVEEGLDRTASGLRDATDGHVRLGTALVAYGETPPTDTGWTSCLYVRGTGPDKPVCPQAYDVVLDPETNPLAAGQTTQGGLAQPYTQISMSKFWTGTSAAPIASTPDRGEYFADVLVHELGHYAFGMPHPHEDGGCVGPRGVSVMTPDPFRTEFDGPAAPCPERVDDPDYVPSWTYLRERFPEVPERPDGPAPGPQGSGDAYSLEILGYDGGEPFEVPVQDDAGSRRDAPRALEPHVRLQPGVAYEGTLGGQFADNADAYAIDGEDGQTLNVRIDAPAPAFLSIRTAAGTPLATPTWSTMSYWPLELLPFDVEEDTNVEEAQLPEDGTYYVVVEGVDGNTPASYQLRATLDEIPAPLGPT